MDLLALEHDRPFILEALHRGQIDYFAVYSPDTKKVYLVPIDHVGKATAYLRLIETANNQKKGVRWGKDYEL